MTTIYKSVNDTSVSVLTAVGTVASSVTKTLTTTASSLDMLDAFVQKAKNQQTERYIAEAVTYHDTLIEDAAMEAAERQAIILKKLNKQFDLAQLYSENFDKLTAAFIPKAD